MVRLKAAQTTVQNRSILFQFHYGTIKRLVHLFLIDIIARFNSTMVRLKELLNDICFVFKRVSIPLWYD